MPRGNPGEATGPEGRSSGLKHPPYVDDSTASQRMAHAKIPVHMDPILKHGIDLFNREEFFECHEVLEAIWTPERGPRRLFLQSLIHFAVAFYHDQQKNPVGAGRQLRKGLRKLTAYLPECEGVDTAKLHRAGLAAVERAEAGLAVGEYPRMAVV